LRLIAVLLCLLSRQAVATLRAAFPDSEFVKNLNDTMLLRYVRARSTLDESIAILKTTIVLHPRPPPSRVYGNNSNIIYYLLFIILCLFNTIYE
jgi:hypothetical protein